jgi:hypothetical protein
VDAVPQHRRSGSTSARYDLLVWTLLALPAVFVLFAAATRFPVLPVPSGALLEYFEQAGRVLSGMIPYRDFPSEYPPLASLPLVLPHLWPNLDHAGYLWAMAIENALLASAIAGVLAVLTRQPGSPWAIRPVLGVYALLVFILAPVLVWRFDLFAALLAVLGLVAALRERPGVAGILLGLGALVKVFPAVLVPMLALRWLASRRAKPVVVLLGSFALLVGVVMAPFLVAAGNGALSFVDYQDARGLQIESLPGGLVLLANELIGVGATIAWLYRAFEVISPINDLLLSVQTPLMVALLAVVLGASWLRFRDDVRLVGRVSWEALVASMVAAVLALIVTNKVLSPQYLIWLLPFGPLLRRGPMLLLTIVCGLTTLIWPMLYEQLLALDAPVIVLLNVRNLLLCGLLCWLLVTIAPIGAARDWGRSGRERTQPFPA